MQLLDFFFFFCARVKRLAPLLLGLLSNDSNAPLKLSVSFVFCPLSSSPPSIALSFVLPFPLRLYAFLCYNSHLLFLSRALISHVAVSRQLQTHTCMHTHTHTHTRAHIHMHAAAKVFLHMHRYGSHQGKVKGLPHYPTPVKTFGVFYALVSKSRGREMEEEEGEKGGIESSKIMKKTDVILGGKRKERITDRE